MALFGVCRSTVICPSVSCLLQKLLVDQSTSNVMFKTLLSDFGLKWHFGEEDDLCYIEGSWEAMISGYEVFTAVQKARDRPEIYHDMRLLYEWSIGQVRFDNQQCDNNFDKCTDEYLVGQSQTLAAAEVKKMWPKSLSSAASVVPKVDADHIYASRNSEDNDVANVNLQSDVKEVRQIEDH